MARNPGIWTVLERGLFLAAVLFAAAAEARGQVVAKPARPPNAEVPESAADEDVAENVFLPADRSTLQKLANSQKLLAQGRTGEAVRHLGSILDGPEDFFFQPDRNLPIHRSLKAEAQRLIGRLPREGRELYELQYGARAQRMLEDAIEGGDTASLAEVSRRFFHTRAGYQATFLLGLHHFDLGRPLAGALTLQRLQEAEAFAEELEPSLSLTAAACWLQAGMPEKAQAVLASLRGRHPALRVAVAGREVPIFTDDAKAVDWLAGLIGSYAAGDSAETDRWLMFRGDVARNAATLGGAPLMNVRWRAPATDDPLIEIALEQYRQLRADQGVPSLPSLHPLAVDDVLLMRTAQNLLAVDFATGKRLWEAPEDGSLELAPGVPAADLQIRQSMLLVGVGQRMWGDMTYGTLSSDGRCAFSIEDLDLGFGPGGAVLFRLGGGNAAPAKPASGEQNPLCNRLAAYEIHSGKLKWQIGGPAGQHALRQPETFFLGPPLPLLGQLYVLGESKGEVRLLALDAANGELLWSQQLAVAEQNALADPLRRWSGASPSYAEGVLVCPTSTGAIVGVDSVARSLLWGYRYVHGRTKNRPNFGMMSVTGAPLPQRWTDASVTIVDGRVLATPVESDAIYCLSLIDGALLWKRPRQDNLYVACSDREKVVLVGPRAVRALRLADGKPAWDGRAVELPEGVMPSGRGFFAGNRYFLPLSSAEVAAIDLDAGKIVQTAKSRKGDVPGNLICHRGKVISQGQDGVDAYCQFDAVRAEAQRRLAANPDDAEALSLRGETLLETGACAEAVALLRRAYELQPELRTRQLLRDALLDGLRAEFARYAPDSAELERLLDDPAQEAVYLRLMAEGWRQAGQSAPALRHCLKLIDLQSDPWPLDQIDKTLSVRRDRWFQGQVALLWNEAKDATAAEIDAAVEMRMKAAMADRSVEPLRRFLDCFGNLPIADAARGELVRRLGSADRLLEAELTQRTEAASGGLKEQDASWPVGKVEIAKTATKNPSVNAFGRHVIEIRGNAEPFFSDASIHFDDGQHTIAGSDGWGRVRWQVSLAAEGQRQNFAYNRALTHARANGHLLLVALGSKIMAIDTLGSGRRGDARLLWTQDFTVSSLDAIGLRPFGLGNVPWQWQRHIQPYDRSNSLGPVTGRYVCFQRLCSLVAVDPRNGETLWVRQDVAPGSDLFGDDEHLLVLSPDREEALLLRAADGELLGTRRVPRMNGRQLLPDGREKTVFARLEDFCLASLGRRLLLWWPEGDQRVLTLIDPLEGRDVWPGRTFSAAAHTCVVGEKAVGVLDRNGRFVLIGLPDGRTIADLQLAAEPALIDISLLGSGGRYYLLTRSSPGGGNSPTPIQPMPGSDPKPIYRGRLYALDDQGNLLWPAPATIENQFLLLDQPSRLPIISFASQVYQQKANGEGRLKMSLLCIDKRNGRVAYKADAANHAGVLDIVGDAGQKTIDLIMQRDTVRLTFTDQPLPPAAADDGKPDSPAPESGGIRALWKSVERVLDRLIDNPETEEDQ